MDFPGSPVVKTPLRASTAGGTDSIPGQGTKIPHAAWCGQKIKTKEKEKKGVSIFFSRNITGQNRVL